MPVTLIMLMLVRMVVVVVVEMVVSVGVVADDGAVGCGEMAHRSAHLREPLHGLEQFLGLAVASSWSPEVRRRSGSTWMRIGESDRRCAGVAALSLRRRPLRGAVFGGYRSAMVPRRVAW